MFPLPAANPLKQQARERGASIPRSRLGLGQIRQVPDAAVTIVVDLVATTLRLTSRSCAIAEAIGIDQPAMAS